MRPAHEAKGECVRSSGGAIVPHDEEVRSMSGTSELISGQDRSLVFILPGWLGLLTAPLTNRVHVLQSSG